jgi:hypothetical protein
VFPVNQCEPHTDRCVGNVREYCEPPCSDIGCTSHWTQAEICGACVQSGTNAQCVLSTTPDPRCAGAHGYCDGDVSVACSDGYAIRKEACAESGSGAVTSPDAGLGPTERPHCVVDEAGSRCVVPPLVCRARSTAACGAPTHCGPVVTATSRTGSPPTAMGGPLAEGVYVLTQLNVYGASPASVPLEVQMTRSFAAGVHSISQYWGGPLDDSSGPYSVQGSNFTWTPTCPEGRTGGNPIGYTATASTFVLYEPQDGGRVHELIHERQ